MNWLKWPTPIHTETWLHCIRGRKRLWLWLSQSTITHYPDPIRGGDHKSFEGEDFIRTVVWEFPNYQKALECKNSKEYKAGWDIAKKTTKRHMQVVEGFNTE